MLARSGALLLKTLGHDGRVQTLTKVVGDLIDLIPAVDLDRLTRRVYHHLAVMTLRQMGPHLYQQICRNVSVKVIR